MRLPEALRKFVHQLRHHVPFLFLVLCQQLVQLVRRIIHQRPRDHEAFDRSGGQFKFEFPENALADGHQTARARFFLNRQLGDSAQPILPEQHFYSISRERLLILADDASF